MTMQSANLTADVLSPEELARYSRHIILPQVGQKGQEALAGARMLIIGMGGLGSPVALYLAAGGVGTLGLADFDVVEEHNLQRQILHRTEGVGTSKIRSARAQLQGLNPHISIRDHREGITIENAIALFADYDLIIDGSDNFPTRYLVNDAAFFARKPVVYGSIFQFEGQVSVFDPAAGFPCYRCLFPQMPDPGSVPNCAEAGVFGALCGVIGSIQAMEAIKYSIGIGESLAGRILILDALSMQFRSLNLKRDRNCPLCGSTPSISDLNEVNYEFECASDVPESETSGGDLPLEISPEEAKALLGSTPPPLLLDVREDFEVGICRIEQSLHIPLSRFYDEVDRVPEDRPVLIYCHHGFRSLKVARFLRERGLQSVTSMRGGIDSWARQVDPRMSRY